MKKLIPALALALISSKADAGFMDGNKLLDLLRSDSPVATGYIMSVSDTEDYVLSLIYQSGGKIPGKFACIPTQVRAGQLNDVVKKFLEENAQYRHYAGASLVSAALAVAFPCVK